MFELTINEQIAISLALDERIETFRARLDNCNSIGLDGEHWEIRISELTAINNKLGFGL